MKKSPTALEINEIRFENLTFRHEGSDPTLQQVDFEFPTKKIVWVKSNEGAGKSTLLQILAGLAVPQHGAYFLNQSNVADMSFEEFLPYRLKIGYSFDYGGLISNRTISDNIALPLVYHKILTPSQAKEKVEMYLEKFDLIKFKDERPAHVPGRVRKLGCLVRAIILDPQILLMDDPSVGLGQDTASLFAETVAELHEKNVIKHVFISSYDDKFMGSYASNIIHLADGNLYHASPDEEKKAANL